MKSNPHPERPDRLQAIAASLARAGIYLSKYLLFHSFLVAIKIYHLALLMIFFQFSSVFSHIDSWSSALICQI